MEGQGNLEKEMDGKNWENGVMGMGSGQRRWEQRKGGMACIKERTWAGQIREETGK